MGDLTRTVTSTCEKAHRKHTMYLKFGRGVVPIL